MPSLMQPPAPALKSCFLLCPYCLSPTFPLQAAKTQTQPVSSPLQNTTDTKQSHITDFTEDVAHASRQSYYNLGQEIISNATSDIIVPRNALAIPSMGDVSLTVSPLGTLRVPPNWGCPQTGGAPKEIKKHFTLLYGGNDHFLRAGHCTSCFRDLTSPSRQHCGVRAHFTPEDTQTQRP